jgi:hypothetical protein
MNRAQLRDPHLDVAGRGRQQLRAVPVAQRRSGAGVSPGAAPIAIVSSASISSCSAAVRMSRGAVDTDGCCRQVARKVGQGRLVSGHRAPSRLVSAVENRTMATVIPRTGAATPHHVMGLTRAPRTHSIAQRGTRRTERTRVPGHSAFGRLEHTRRTWIATLTNPPNARTCATAPSPRQRSPRRSRSGCSAPSS